MNHHTYYQMVRWIGVLCVFLTYCTSILGLSIGTFLHDLFGPARLSHSDIIQYHRTGRLCALNTRYCSLYPKPAQDVARRWVTRPRPLDFSEFLFLCRLATNKILPTRSLNPCHEAIRVARASVMGSSSTGCCGRRRHKTREEHPCFAWWIMSNYVC